jgi:metal-responsive CopG/Arc/MetJ family transcriptional regulator
MPSFDKIIQIPLDQELLAELDRASRERRSSRAALIREACRDWLRRLRERRLDEIYEEGYRRIPPDSAASEAQMKMLSEVLPEEDW